jgi:hypothetical protein
MMLQNLMENYLNNKTSTVYPVSDKSSLPVEPKKNKWIVENKKLKKVFEFESSKQKESFVLEILKYIRESDAEIEFRVRNKKIAIVLHALSPEVSEIEFEAKSDIDKIRKDVVYYFAKKE